jgi:glyoxylase-like metal-dependent hydrolase (beta-lactamase superfamily II)
MNKHFGRYHWATTKLPEPTMTFSGELEIRVGGIPIQLTQLAPAHTVGDLIAYLPRQRACFAGDVIFATSELHPGDHPVHWAGPIAGIIDGCERVLATGAEIIVPGHGPVLERSGVDAHLRYLDYLRDRSHEYFAAGVPLGDAARRIIAEDAYPDLHLRERIVLTVGIEYRHLAGTEQPPMVELISQLAHLAWSLERPGVPVPRSTMIPTPR